jgi:hypothetical protein
MAVSMPINPVSTTNKRDHEQRLFGGAHQAPELLQRHAGQDRQQRLATIFIDFALQA